MLFWSCLRDASSYSRALHPNKDVRRSTQLTNNSAWLIALGSSSPTTTTTPDFSSIFNSYRLFQQHISRLSAVITPLHPSLLVRRKYLCESPWPSAQRHASAIGAHKSPRGKLNSALRCCRAIMHLLKLADESEAPGADDFTPVLVFVLIKVSGLTRNFCASMGVWGQGRPSPPCIFFSKTRLFS